MPKDIAKGVRDLTFRMRLLKAIQEEQMDEENLSERELLILELLNEKGEMTVSQVAAADGGACDSTISNTITKLWRDKKMVTKTISPENQRTTIIGLTDKGRKTIEIFNQQRDERFKTLFEAINVTDGEKEVLLSVLHRATNFFDRHLGIENTNNKEVK
jgi:DNA-binding MarR family transcriptional regulator